MRSLRLTRSLSIRARMGSSAATPLMVIRPELSVHGGREFRQLRSTSASENDVREWLVFEPEPAVLQHQPTCGAQLSHDEFERNDEAANRLVKRASCFHFTSSTKCCFFHPLMRLFLVWTHVLSATYLRIIRLIP